MKRRVVAGLTVAGAIGAPHLILSQPALAANPPARTTVTASGRALAATSTGPDVAGLQRLLGVPMTGIYSGRTERAVRMFQLAHGLEVDGVAGPATWRALRGEDRGHLGDRILRVGDRGAAVSTLQWALGLPATGRFGTRTERAVRRYQRTHGLVVDGEAGRGTLDSLRRHNRFARGALTNTEPVATPVPTLQEPAASEPSQPAMPPTPAVGAGLGKRVATLALQQLGVRYVWGGEDPSGFDCSGLVQYVYGEVGITLPRVAHDQYYAGPHVPRDQLRAGDLVFFHELGHVGIYLGGGRFIHAPHTGTVVQVTTLTGWYVDTYVGATRITG